MERIVSFAFYAIGTLVLLGLIWLIWDYFAV
jgi:hypothetical protein